MVRDAWSAVYWTDTHVDPAPFLDRYKEYLREGEAVRLPPLTGASLAAGQAHMNPHSAGGTDGWRVQELKELPLSILHRLAGILTAVEGG